MMMLYNMVRNLIQVSTQQWLQQEFLSYRWFIVVGILVAVYALWFILLDKSRASELLLLGSLAAVAYSFNNLVISTFLGLVEYQVRVLPVTPSLLFSSVTVCPFILMLAQQYAPHWKGFFLWTAVGMVALSAIFAVYTRLDILEWHNGYNVWIHGVELFAAGVGTRLVFRWITDTTRRHTEDTKPVR